MQLHLQQFLVFDIDRRMREGFDSFPVHHHQLEMQGDETKVCSTFSITTLQRSVQYMARSFSLAAPLDVYYLQAEASTVMGNSPSHKGGSTIPAGVDPDDWIDKNVDKGTFPGSTTVKLAFRIAGSKEHEHIVNYLAAMATSSPLDVFPGGRLCHAELIAPLRRDWEREENVYFKNSVTKMTCTGKDEKGNVRYKPGCVHCKYTHPSEWKSKYAFIEFELPRECIIKGLRFCILNDGMPFNSAGFNANLVIPGGRGVREWDESLMHIRRPYFCSEFIVTALLAMFSLLPSGDSYLPTHFVSVIRATNPATSNPNKLYRRLKKADRVFDSIPLGKDVVV